MATLKDNIESETFHNDKSLIAFPDAQICQPTMWLAKHFCMQCHGTYKHVLSKPIVLLHFD